MFDVIRKEQYWEALDNPQVFKGLDGFTLRALDGLKHIQDAWTLQQLIGLRGARVLEVGGGLSRVLPALDASNERWNLDEFLGDGNGVTNVPDMPGIKLVRSKLGDFCTQIPDGYFDVVFSISVIEHIPGAVLDEFWRDHGRVLRPGGLGYHAIDLYLTAEPSPGVQARLDMYRKMPATHGMELVQPGEVATPLVFCCDMASNSDWGMWRWNKSVPALADVRRNSQSVSLGMQIRRGT